jgi:hypothetical protein
MKQRLLGISLIASAALALVADGHHPAQAFSLNSTLQVTNTLEGTGMIGAPATVVVGESPDLVSFGDLWDISFADRTIGFRLNSPQFGNLETGNDIYTFEVLTYAGALPVNPFAVQVTSLGQRSFEKPPVVALLEDNQGLTVTFEPFFVPEGVFLNQIPGELEFKVDLVEVPVPVPTPALLPGLAGLGLAVLRRRQSQEADTLGTSGSETEGEGL